MKSNELVCSILDYLEHNINDDINIFNLSKIFCYDKFYLMKKFKSELGISIIAYVNRIRIYNSLKDLDSDELLLKVAISNGFSSLEYYLNENNKKDLIKGVSPSVMRKYFERNLDKEELLLVRKAIKEMSEFKAFIYEYRFGPISEEEQKLIFLPNKKYAA